MGILNIERPVAEEQKANPPRAVWALWFAFVLLALGVLLGASNADAQTNNGPAAIVEVVKILNVSELYDTCVDKKVLQGHKHKEARKTCEKVAELALKQSSDATDDISGASKHNHPPIVAVPYGTSVVMTSTGPVYSRTAGVAGGSPSTGAPNGW